MEGREGDLFGKTFIAVGPIPAEAEKDELLELRGDWVEKDKYGRQFDAKAVAHVLPSTSDGVSKYLAKKVKGLGPMKAAKLLDHFGINLPEVLDSDAERLREVGFNSALIDRIVTTWRADRIMRQLEMFLTEHGIEANTWAKRMYETFGAGAVEIIKANPYKLAKMDGIGFKKADGMAAKLGVPKTSPLRIDAAFTHILQEATNEGHMFLHMDALLKKVAQLAGGDGKSVETDPETGEPYDVFHALPRYEAEFALHNAIKRGELVEERIPVKGVEYDLEYLPHLYRAESKLAERSVELLDVPARHVQGLVQTMAQAQKTLGLVASVEQERAAIAAMMNSFSIITGGPGTGKSTITKIILFCMEALGWKVKLAAPTGRAAKRLTEVTGHAASTVHKLLEFDPKLGKFTRDRENPIEANALILDEWSMGDTELTYKIMEAIPPNCHVVVLGDVDQLPSVGPGMVLKDLIQCGQIATTRLDKIFRQAEGSLIIRNAYRIITGQYPNFLPKGQESDCFLMEVPLKLEGKKSVEDIGNLERMDGKVKVPATTGYLQSMLKKLCKENIPAKYKVDPIRDIQVLAPMKKGTAGVHELNLVLQDALNPYGEPVKFGAREFRVGDRIMVFKNNYDLETYNGDIGFVQGVVEIAAKKDDDDDDFDDEPDGAVSTFLYSKEELAEIAGNKVEQKPAKMDRYLKVMIDDVEKCYPEKESGNLQLAYCQTIHKSQGSEFPIVCF